MPRHDKVLHIGAPVVEVEERELALQGMENDE